MRPTLTAWVICCVGSVQHVPECLSSVGRLQVWWGCERGQREVAESPGHWANFGTSTTRAGYMYTRVLVRTYDHATKIALQLTSHVGGRAVSELSG